MVELVDGVHALGEAGHSPPPDLVVQVDLPDVATEVVTSARAAGLLESLWVTSPDLEVLLGVRGESPATRLLHVCDPAREVHGPERHAATLRSEEIEGVLVHRDTVRAGAVVLMHRFTRLVAVEGIEYLRHLERARDAGADLLCCSDPAVLPAGTRGSAGG